MRENKEKGGNEKEDCERDTGEKSKNSGGDIRTTGLHVIAPTGRPLLPRLPFPRLIKYRRQDARRQLKYGPLDPIAPSPSVLLFFCLVLRS